MQFSKQDIEQEAISLVRNEVTKFKDGEFFITENVSIATRPLIRLLRKNYWGIFDDPSDPVTGRPKQWIPATELIVDAVRKNADLDLKDVNFRPASDEGRPVTALVRGFVRKQLYDQFFGEVLNDSILQMCIDGTVIWKTYTINENGKLRVKRKTVDTLNVFIDPTADSIQDAARFTERALLSPTEIQAMTGWQNTEDIKTAPNLHRSEMDMLHPVEVGDYVDVYETWGRIPKRLLTGNKDDTELVDGHVVMSGIETGDLRVHLIEKNTTKDKNGDIIKPYEEARFIKAPNRWAGIGPAEMVKGLQEWINTIVNLRINKNTNASLGLFKVKAGAGVTQQMLSNLVARGVIKLNSMDDLENLEIKEASESSYRDEEVAKQWAFDVTSTYDITRGAPLPASSTATSAVIEDRNAKSSFVLVREAIGLFLQRWMDRHYLPHVPKMMKQAKLTTLFSDFDDIDELRTRIVSYLAMQMLDDMKEGGYVPPEQDVQLAMQEAEAALRSKKDLFVDVLDDIIASSIDTVTQFTNEETDVAVTIKNLVDMSAVVPPDAQKDFIVMALDLMNLKVPESLRQSQPMLQDPSMMQQPQGQMPQGQMPMPQMPDTSMMPPTDQQLTTAANLPM